MNEYTIPISELVKAKCCDCRAGYADSRHMDCEVTSCPLYILAKTSKKTPRVDWIFDHFRKYTAMISDKLPREKIIDRVLKNMKLKKYPVGRGSILRAKCKECMNKFRDGRVDCKITSCPLYCRMPYRELTPEFNWLWDLGYTTRHQIKIFEMGITRGEYVNQRYQRQAKPEPVIRYRKLASQVVHEHGTDDAENT